MVGADCGAETTRHSSRMTVWMVPPLMCTMIPGSWQVLHLPVEGHGREWTSNPRRAFQAFLGSGWLTTPLLAHVVGLDGPGTFKHDPSQDLLRMALSGTGRESNSFLRYQECTPLSSEPRA